VNRFIDHSPIATTSNFNSLTGLHTLKVTVTAAHKIKSSISAFIGRCLVTSLNNGCSFTMFLLSVSWERILIQEESHSRYHRTTTRSLIPFLPFPAAANSEDSTQFSSDYYSLLLQLLNSQFQFYNLPSHKQALLI
jgi:hypothetical protein